MYMHTHLLYSDTSVISALCILLCMLLYSLCDYNPTISHTGNEDCLYPTMAASYGKLDKFDPTSGNDWIQYIKRMVYYFLANGISSSNKQQTILISAMSTKAHKISAELNYSKACELKVQHTRI